MVDLETLKRIIVENQQFIASVELNRRDYAFEPKGRYVLVGLRQAGKSYLLYQRIQSFLSEGRKIEEMCYVNFDDERIAGIRAEELGSILDAYHALYEGEPILFFDEIQNIVGWEHFARRLANEKRMIFVTGSNAKMLSREVASTLGGRFSTLDVAPYSFAEYLRACGISLGKNWRYGKTASDVERRFDTYLRFGGLPECVEHVDKRGWLNGLFDKIFFGDMVVRNGVKNEEALRLTVKKLAESVCQSAAYNRIANLIKSAGVSTTTASVRDYVRFMRESCLIFSIPNAAAGFSEREGIKKHYFADNGLLNIFLSNPDSALLENLCAIRLRSIYGESLSFFKRNIEVDFYIPDEGLAVQACWTAKDASTLEREVESLRKLDAYAPLKRLVIVTRGERDTVRLKNGKTVEIVDAASWLLEDAVATIRASPPIKK